MLEITSIAFYFLLKRLLHSSINLTHSYDRISESLKVYKQAILRGDGRVLNLELTGANFACDPPEVKSPAKKIQRNNHLRKRSIGNPHGSKMDHEATFLRVLLVDAIRGGREIILPINQIIRVVHQGKKSFCHGNSAYLGFSTKVTLILFLALAGKWLVGLAVIGISPSAEAGSSTQSFLSFFIENSSFISVLVALTLLLIARGCTPGTWIVLARWKERKSEHFFSDSFREYLRARFLGNVGEECEYYRVWKNLTERERYSGVDLADEKSIILDEWVFNAEQRSEVALERFRDFLPVLEIFGGSTIALIALSEALNLLL